MKEEIISIMNEIIPGFDPECTSLIENGILSSLDILQLISEIDDRLDITIPVTAIKPENFNSVDRIVSMLSSI